MDGKVLRKRKVRGQLRQTPLNRRRRAAGRRRRLTSRGAERRAFRASMALASEGLARVYRFAQERGDSKGRFPENECARYLN